MDLIRRVYVEERPKPGERYLSEAELREEFFRPVPYYFGREFSKLEAIERISRKVIASDTMLSEKVRRQLIRETRWLLVDQGLLFAQTRARHYPDDEYPEKRFGQRTKINQTLLKNRKEVLRTEKNVMRVIWNQGPRRLCSELRGLIEKSVECFQKSSIQR